MRPITQKTFDYPAHFDTVDDAKVFAEFWMSLGFFDACRCDKHIDPIFKFPCELKFPGELKAGVFILDRGTRTQVNDIDNKEEQ